MKTRDVFETKFYQGPLVSRKDERKVRRKKKDKMKRNVKKMYESE